MFAHTAVLCSVRKDSLQWCKKGYKIQQLRLSYFLRIITHRRDLHKEENAHDWVIWFLSQIWLTPFLSKREPGSPCCHRDPSQWQQGSPGQLTVCTIWTNMAWSRLPEPCLEWNRSTWNIKRGLTSSTAQRNMTCSLIAHYCNWTGNRA